MKTALDNKKMAKEQMDSLFEEYMIGKNLFHPNIIGYHYFIAEYN